MSYHSGVLEQSAPLRVRQAFADQQHSPRGEVLTATQQWEKHQQHIVAVVEIVEELRPET